MGQQVGSVVGAIIGSFIPFVGTYLGAAIGGLIGGAIKPEVIRAPGIGDAQEQTSAAGIPRPVVYGHPAPFSGNIIDGEHKARKIIVRQRQGKGGGPVVKSERFIITVAIRICEGPIAGVLRIWRNGEVVYDRRTLDQLPAYSGATDAQIAAHAGSMQAKSAAFANNVTIYLGTESQLPDPTLEAMHGVGNTPYYRGTSYIVIRDDDVTQTGGMVNQYQFEVLAVGTEEAVLVELDPHDFGPTPFWSGYSNGLVHWIDSLPTDSTVAQIFRVDSFDITYAGRMRVYVLYDNAPLPGGGPTDINAYNDFAGSLIWSSGWWAAGEAEIADLTNYEVTHGRSAPSVQIGIPADATLVIPRSATGVVVIGDVYGPGYQSLSMHVRWPVHTGITATTSPELPNVLFGSDGVLYYPGWITDPGLPAMIPGAITLQSVVEAIAERCNVPANKLNASALAGDIIPGLLIAQQFTGADCLRPTQQVYLYDLPEIDGPIVAVKRGGAVVDTITDDDLLDTGDDDELIRPQHVEYPARVSVVTQDPAADYAPIPQVSRRTSPNVVASSEVMIQSPIPLGADEAKRRAEIIHKVLYAQAEGIKEFSLPEEFGRLVPSDCIAYAGKRWLIEQKESAEGEHKLKCVYDRVSAYTSAAIGTPAPPPVLPGSGLRGPTQAQWMNLPLLRDADDKLGFYVAVAAPFEGWDGALIQGSLDGVTWLDLGDIAARSVTGTLVTALADAAAEVIDPSSVVVNVNGELFSVTEAELFGELNACVIGDEVCQFQTATQDSDGLYTLTTLTRGRLDTEPQAHPIGTRFVLLGYQMLVEAPVAWIGQTISVRAVTYGSLADNNQTTSFVWNPARSQTEWAPVQFVGTRDSSGNAFVSWVGRGRLGTNASPIHSSYFDGYRVTFDDGVTTVNYTTASPSYEYSVTQQATDFGSIPESIDVTIVAMNRITGASSPLTGTITGEVSDEVVLDGGGA